jgi:ATP-dependent Zn protease
MNTLAMYLGGHVAEKIVFGDDNVTTGSSSDIEKATNFISRMIKESGMGNLLVSTHIPTTDTNRYHYDTTGDSIKQIEKWITDATLLAEKTLNAQKVLLLKMANVLSDTTIMKKDQIQELSSKHGIGFNHDRIITNGDDLFYRKHLKNQVKETVEIDKPAINVGYDIVLNKDE